MNLDLVARGLDPLAPRALIQKLPISSMPWNKAAFVMFWEAQSQASSLAYLALVAFFSIWHALVAMLVWSLLATVFFFAARERGYPNMLNAMPVPKRRAGIALVWFTVATVGRMMLAGVQATLFARCSSFLLVQRASCGGPRRIARFFAIAFSLTFFGVTMAEHVLRKAGYQGARLFRLGLVGPFLHVPYRVMFSAAVVAFAQGAFSRIA